MTPTELDRFTTVFRAVMRNATLELSDALTARDVAGWDSLNHVNLMISLEEEFNINFKTSEISELKNVGELKALISQKLFTKT